MALALVFCSSTHSPELSATELKHIRTAHTGRRSDVIGGCVMTNDDALGEKLHFVQKAVGAVPSPFDCYLVLRSLKTLGVRMRQHLVSAGKIAEWLSGHPRVKRVLYPGLPSHPGHAIAARQMKGFGGMITFELDGDVAQATRFLKALEIFACAESLGGVESLAEHPAIMTHASVPEAQRRALGIDDGLVRLSIGIEDAADLWADIERGLAS